MKFLIEADVFPETEKELLKTLTEMKIENTLWNPEGRPPYLAADNHVFFIGSLQTAVSLMRVGARFQIWLGSEFDYSYFGVYLKDLLNNDFDLMAAGQIMDNIKKDSPTLDRKEQIFVRSNSGYKKLPGGLYTADLLYVELERLNIFREEILVGAEKKKIDEEYRAVIRSVFDEKSDQWAHKVVTSSSYPEEGKTLTADQIKTIEADLNTSTYHPYPLWILDVAITNGVVKQLEANSINTSGFYGCNLKAIIEEILDIEKKEIQ